MDVSGVGQSPAGFSAVPETALDPQRSSQAGGPEKLGQVRQAPLDLLSNERLGRELVSLGLRPDAAKLLAARALVLQQGTIDLSMLLDVERSLQGMTLPGSAEAEAAAFLVARRLPATTETVSWVLGRQNAAEPAGMRMLGIIQRFVAAMAARTESQAMPAKGDAPSLAAPPSGGEPAAKEAPSAGTAPAPGAAAPKAASTASTSTASAPAQPSAPTPTSPSTTMPTPAPAGTTTPQGEACAPAPEPVTPETPQPAQAKTATNGASTSAPTPGTAASSAPTTASPQSQPVTTAQAVLAAVTSELAEIASPEGSPVLPGAKAPDVAPVPGAQPAAKPPESVERELFARLQSLALPEGKAKEVETALRRLVQALRPQEADLARGEVAEAKERLTSMAAKAIAKAPQDANVRAVHDEIRFQQVNSARHEGQTPHEFIIPVWWKGGSGEIRVQERPKGAARRSEEASAPVRVVMALDTPHLGAIHIDLLLAQRQVNCLVAAQDQGAADFLSVRLTELRSAIEETGIRVNALGMKSFAADAEAHGPGDAKGVDYYG